jgi:PPOX class probable F420-dependent enzyme
VRAAPAIGVLSEQGSNQIPAFHRDLVQCSPVAALTTVMAGSSPQTSVVWCDFDGDCVRVNTMRGFAKERNMRRNPRVTLLCYDPRQPLRYLEVRGTVVEMTQAGAAEHLDQLASSYAGRPVRYFGDAIPARFADTEVPVLCRIRPTPPRRARRHGEGGKEMTTRVAPQALAIPASHLDLLTRPICGVLTTMGGDGQPQSSLVWADHDGACARVNTTLERHKGRNLLANPKVSLLVIDPDNTARYLQVRGEVELVTDGALEHLSALPEGHPPRCHASGEVQEALSRRWCGPLVAARYSLCAHTCRPNIASTYSRAEATDPCWCCLRAIAWSNRVLVWSATTSVKTWMSSSAEPVRSARSATGMIGPSSCPAGLRPV